MDKGNFFTGQPVFSQLLNLIPHSVIDRAKRKYKSNHYCKKFMAYDHLVTMLYAGFFQCTSLRELTTGLQANSTRLNHLGLKYTPRRSTLADANKRRSCDFFADVYQGLYDKYFGLPDSRLKNKADQLYIIDSTTFSLFTSIMRGTGSYKSDGRKKGGAKAHVMINAQHDVPAFIDLTEGKVQDLNFLNKVPVPEGSTVVMDRAYVNYSKFKQWDKQSIRWITRLRVLSYITPISELPVTESSYDNGIVRDRLVRLGRPGNNKLTPLIIGRIIDYFDKEKNKNLSFVTNDFQSEPETIAAIYKKRWQIELLFKRIKQRYPLKYFLGDNPNAIKIQIWAALLCDLLIKIIHKQVNELRKKAWAYANLASMIKHYLMTYIKLKEFLLNPEKTLRNYKPPNPQLTIFTYSGASG
jgi:DDE family transposase/uncharacterized protein DUF4372